MSPDHLIIDRLVVGPAGRTGSDPISLVLGPGLVILCGPNGCGKSTLLRTLAGILPPQSGSASIRGHDLRKHGLRYRWNLGFMPDRISLPASAVGSELLQLVRWARQDQDDPADSEVARRFDLAPWCNRTVAQLSLGQRRRISLVAALAHRPLVALLDEPTAGLDADGIVALREICDDRSRQGQLTICVAHDPLLVQSVTAQVIEWSKLSRSICQ